jgi:hypothetical protein
MKSANVFRVLAFGDVIGDPGKKGLYAVLPKMRKAYEPDLIVINGENSAQGFGITNPITKNFFDNGIDVITTGNHVWQKKEIWDFIDTYPALLRPINYPPNTPGHGSVVLEKNGVKLAVVNAMGRIYMDPIECPFQAMEKEVERLNSLGIRHIFLDFHGEATSEKQIMGWKMDGKVSAVWGTHTHVPTADERILPSKTAYISDLGMCGCIHSVIGMKIEDSDRRVVKHLPVRFQPAEFGPVEVMGAVIDVHRETGNALMINRFKETVG